MAQTNVNIRMDEDLKKRFDVFCDDIGMSMTTAICVFVKAALRANKIPFEITAEGDPFYHPANIAYLENAAKELETGRAKLTEHGLIEVEE